MSKKLLIVCAIIAVAILLSVTVWLVAKNGEKVPERTEDYTKKEPQNTVLEEIPKIEPHPFETVNDHEPDFNVENYQRNPEPNVRDAEVEYGIKEVGNE